MCVLVGRPESISVVVSRQSHARLSALAAVVGGGGSETYQLIISGALGRPLIVYYARARVCLIFEF